MGEASASQTVELKRLTLQVESLQITDQGNGEVTANLVDVLPGDIVTAAGGAIDTAQTARNLAQRVYAGFAALSTEAQARVVAYVQGEIQTVIDSPYFTTLTQVSLYNHIDVSDLVTGDEQLITDYAYQAIGGDEGLPGGVVSRHVVRAGESLQSIAEAYYGSTAYWYLIAEANGLEGTEELKAGTTLSIPNAVANSVNDKESYKVYSESEIIEINRTPTLNLPKPHRYGNLSLVLDIKERYHAQAKESPGFTGNDPLLPLRLPLCSSRLSLRR